MRRLTLLTAAVLAAMAMTTATALADDPVYPGDPFTSVVVNDHDTGNPCGTVTAGPPVTGGCVGTMHIDDYSLSPSINCTSIELGGVHFATDGKFRASNVSNSVCNGTTTFVACKDPSGVPYQWYGTFFEYNDRLWAQITMCVQNVPGNGGPVYTFADNNRIEITNEIAGDFQAEFAWSQFGNIETTDWTIWGDLSIDY